MFIIDDNPTFQHKVVARKPVDGGFKEEAFKVTFNLLPAEEQDTYDLTTTEGSTSFLRRVIASIDDVAGADGKLLPYSDELRDKLIAMPFVRAAIARGYFEAITGARAGN